MYEFLQQHRVLPANFGYRRWIFYFVKSRRSCTRFVTRVAPIKVRPAIETFEPDMIFVSAGFDAVRGDPLGGYSCGWAWNLFGYSWDHEEVNVWECCIKQWLLRQTKSTKVYTFAIWNLGNSLLKVCVAFHQIPTLNHMLSFPLDGTNILNLTVTEK